ncbi:MAG: UbiH/UbiF/VisC/COQ6 family ubiquinone biosynthesis hydroxylase, partial [Gammaproteobacteria bacterium]
QTQHYDIVIVGGGMVGSALACALSNDNGALNIAIIEGREPELNWDDKSFDLRVSAITRGSQQLFEQLGIWETLKLDRTSPYGEMFVWDATGDGHIHFDCADVGEPNLGHIIENRVITRALSQRIEQLDNVRVFCPSRPKDLIQNNNNVQLELDNGTILETALIIGADGANSWTRQQAGIEITVRDYSQHAVVTTVKTSLPHQETAWQRFLPTGPLAFLPLINNYSSIVWSTTPEKSQELLDLDEAEFKTALASSFDHKLGDIIELGPRAAFPLKGQHAKHYVQPHLALVGDSAHTIHPLAGQGVNLGFADINKLAEVIAEDYKNGKAIGSFKSLRRYERARRGDNLLMLESMGAFKTLFSNENTGLSTLRNIGLNITNKFTPAKHLFMRHAMGLSN